MIEGGEFHAWNTEWKNAWNARKDIFFFFLLDEFLLDNFLCFEIEYDICWKYLFRSFVGNFVL